MSPIETFIQVGFSICLMVNSALFIPQIITLLKTQSAQGVSLLTFLGFNVIQLFTLLHGLLENDLILVVGCIVSLITCGTVSFLIIYYRYIKKTAVVPT